MSDLLAKHGFNKRLDHGELSIPNRTRNIDAQIDSYKRDKSKADAKALEDIKFINSERIRVAKEQAWSAYLEHGDAFIKHYQKKIKANGYNPRVFLKFEAKESPERFLIMINKFKEEQGYD